MERVIDSRFLEVQYGRILSGKSSLIQKYRRKLPYYPGRPKSKQSVGNNRESRKMTTANFYSMVEIVFLFNQEYTLRDESGITVGRDDRPLQPGKYFIVTTGSITVSDETWLVRAASGSTATNTEEFRHAIRERDRRCVMTGRGAINAAVGFWVGLDTVHVFPPAHERHWVKHGYGDWITL